MQSEPRLLTWALVPWIQAAESWIAGKVIGGLQSWAGMLHRRYFWKKDCSFLKLFFCFCCVCMHALVTLPHSVSHRICSGCVLAQAKTPSRMNKAEWCQCSPYSIAVFSQLTLTLLKVLHFGVTFPASVVTVSADSLLPLCAVLYGFVYYICLFDRLHLINCIHILFLILPA